MPTYSFFCESCNHLFEVKNSRDKANVLPKCPACRSKKNVYRDYQADDISVTEGFKTVGSIADQNAGKLSLDEKEHIKKLTRRPHENT